MKQNIKDQYSTPVEVSDTEFESTSLKMCGIFVIIASCIVSGAIFFFAFRRGILAFSAQQVMPVAQEGIEKMAPTVGNVVKEISKGINLPIPSRNHKLLPQN